MGVLDMVRPTKIDNAGLEDQFNTPLRNLFGVDTVTGKPMWRIVWSDDEFEVRYGVWSDFSPAGILLRQVQEARKVPKYSYIHERYVLEHLVGVPQINAGELPTVRMSYEPIRTFQDKNGDFLPPNLLAAKLIINTVLTAMGYMRDGRAPLKKFYDEEFSQEASIEEKNKRIAEIEEYLWGDDSQFHDALASGSAVMLNVDDKKKVH
jgi:hypothetical protein